MNRLCLDRGCVFISGHYGHHSWWGTRSTPEQKAKRKDYTMAGKTKSPSAMTAGDQWWIVRGNWLPNGEKVAGPFSSNVDANHARDALERFAGGETFFIDSTETFINV
jgi:hypothetical protein